MPTETELQEIYKQFHACAPIFIALGDEIRQKLILDIVDAHETGINVTNLSAKSKLSRPAISHHLKVLKDSGLVKPIKVGTQIFYRINLKKNLESIAALISSVQEIIRHMDENASPTSEQENEERAATDGYR